MKSQELAPLYDQQQIYHRRRRSRCALKQWTEKSVWSLVCAMELGLVTESVPKCTTVNRPSAKWASTVRKVNNSFMVAATNTNRSSSFLSTSRNGNVQKLSNSQCPNPRARMSNTQYVPKRAMKMQQASFSQMNELQIDHLSDSSITENSLRSEMDMSSELASDHLETDGQRGEHSYAEKGSSSLSMGSLSSLSMGSLSNQSMVSVNSQRMMSVSSQSIANPESSSQSEYAPENESTNASEYFTEPGEEPNSSEASAKKSGRSRRSDESDCEYEIPKRKKKPAKKRYAKPKPKIEIDETTTDRSTTEVSSESYDSNKSKLAKKKKKPEVGSSEEENEELHRRRLEIRRNLEKAREESRQNEAATKRTIKKGFLAEVSEHVQKCEMIRMKLFGKPDDESSEPKVTTRRSLKNKDLSIYGKLVWGNCSGWWPALIVEADHVGMLPEEGKLWVYWIGEARISLLNEKTQVEPFSRHLKSRLAIGSQTPRMRAVDATMQMLRARLDCPLTKPYYTWLETNLAGMFELLDEIRFYPYPNPMQDRIRQLKRKNSRAVERFLEEKKRTEEKEVKKLKETDKKESSIPQSQVQKDDEDPARLPLREQYPGAIVWAKILGHNWWPAMIVDYRDCCMREPTFGCQWTIWYGDYQLSEIHHHLFLKFDKGLELMREYTYAVKVKKPNFVIGVIEAAKDYGDRLGANTEGWTLEDVFKNIPKLKPNKTTPDVMKPPTSYVSVYDKYTPLIVKKLNEARKEPKINFARANDIIHSDDLQAIVTGKGTFESLCLKCMKIVDGEKETHPFFVGSLCKECAEEFKPFMFVFGNDGKCFYCTVCSATGTVLICDKEDCPRVYCAACVKHLLCPATYRDVLQEDPWFCFLCQADAKTPIDPSSVLKPRADWREKIFDVFRTNSKVDRLEPDGKERRKIRVLSLFDGLATGLIVLEKLGLVVEVYYASEIDADSMMVSTAYFGNRIKHLGDVRKITKEKLEEIAPIDLLIGGSPCNDLSLANPGRRGLNDPKGTGILFFEYVRILKLMKKINKKRQLFWLYENVASMPTKFRLEINKHLRQEPDTIDSADFSPQHRLRLYWHNLPVKEHTYAFESPQDVQDILTPHCQRYALVKKIRTVTTRGNSLRQGVQHLKPILMQDKSDTIWITELEEIFGFPRHYTDVKNLSATKRQKLIGKSWSVQTLTAILGSLRPFFECNTKNDNSIKLETQV